MLSEDDIYLQLPEGDSLGEPIEAISDDKYVMTVVNSDENFIFLVTEDRIFVYKITDGGSKAHINRKEGIEHNIENAYHELIHGYYTHGYLSLIKKHTMYYFKIMDSYDRFEYNTTFPASYFRIAAFTNMTSMMSNDNCVAMQTEIYQLTLMCFENIFEPKYYSVIKNKKNAKPILWFNIVSRGTQIAILYKESLDFHLLRKDNPKLLRSFRITNPHVERMVHKEERRMVILLYERDPKYDSRLVSIYNTHCTEADLLNGNPLCRKKRDIYLPSKLFNPQCEFSQGLIKWEAIGNNATAVYDHGSMYLVYPKTDTGPLDIGLFPGTKVWSKGSSPPEYLWDHSLLATYRSSNLILLRNLRNGYHHFTHISLESRNKNRKFCHPSCYKVFGCDKPFVVCKSQQKWITIGIFITSFLTLLLLLCIVNKLFDRTERQLNKYEDKKSKNYNRALEKASVDPENKVIHFRYSKMTPSMIEAVDAKIHQEVEDDEEEQHGSLLRIPKFNLRKGSGDKDKEGSGSTPKSIKEPGQLKSPQERSQVHHRSKSPNQSPASMKPSLKKPLLKES